jgi:clan AA aspartic protease (TIGR02281 family)
MEEYEAGNYDSALEWFDKTTQKDPSNGYAYMYSAILRNADKQHGVALTAINKAINVISKKDKTYLSAAYAIRGNIYAEMEDTITALKDYEIALKVDPSNTSIYKTRAQIYYEQGKYTLADADYNKMIEIDPGDVIGYVGIGRNAIAQKQWDTAQKYLDYLIKLSPEYSSGYSFRAEALLGQGMYSEAIDDIIKALSINGDNKAYYLMMNMDKSAFNTLKAKLQIQANTNPNEAGWYYYLGQINEEANLYKDAITYYYKGNDKDASSVFLERIAKCYFELGDYDQALSVVNNAINMNNEDFDLVMLKGNIYNEMGDYAKAISQLDYYIEKNPKGFFGYYRRGWYKDEANDVAGAIDDYSMAIIIEPKFAYSYCGRGRFYLERGEIDLAMSDFKKIIELDTVPSAGSCAHYAYHFLGEDERAIEFMNRILADDPESMGNYYDAACLYAIMGRSTESISYLRHAFELGYRRFAHIVADHDLDSIRDLSEFKSLINEYREKHEKEISIVVSTDISADDTISTINGTVEIPFIRENGVAKVKCAINDLPLHFVFDTGASDVTLSLIEANFMLKNDYIKPADIIGTARYIDANGDITEGTVVNLRRVNFGDLELDNVRASVVRNQKAPLLLGQSVLGRLGKIEIDNANLKLKITQGYPLQNK